jgi:hypothetical protein
VISCQWSVVSGSQLVPILISVFEFAFFENSFQFSVLSSLAL